MLSTIAYSAPDPRLWLFDPGHLLAVPAPLTAVPWWVFAVRQATALAFRVLEAAGSVEVLAQAREALAVLDLGLVVEVEACPCSFSVGKLSTCHHCSLLAKAPLVEAAV